MILLNKLEVKTNNLMVIKFSSILGQSKRLRLLLSFAVGSLLGDVFLHLLPEAYRLSLKLGVSPHSTYNSLWVWVLSGIFTFFIVEVIFNTNNNKVCRNLFINQEWTQL